MVNKDLKIEIRPIPNRGRITEFSKNLEYFARFHTVTPLVNSKTMRFVTGLSEEDKKYIKDNAFPYEIDDNFNQKKPHELWESQMIKVHLENTPMFLYPGVNIVDFIKWKYLLASPFVYSSESEISSGEKPSATHYIYNESDEMSIKASKIRERNKLLKKVSDLSLEKKRQIVLIINDENTDTKNEEYLDVKLEEILDDNKKRAELARLVDTKSSDVDVAFVVKSAIQKNVLKKTRKGIFYFDTNLGLKIDDVIEHLSSPDGQEILITIKSKIE